MRKIFLNFIEKALRPDITYLALNFAYPMSPVSRDGYLDGNLIMGTKEHSFEGLVGKNIGETIEKYIFDTLKRKIHVAIANDTVCLLLSGLTQYRWNGLVGGIVGTGLNFAIFLDEATIVNLEAANFDKFEQSPEGKLIDQASARPNSALFEKETSGGYGEYPGYYIKGIAYGTTPPAESAPSETAPAETKGTTVKDAGM